MYLDTKEWLSLDLYLVAFLFLFTVKFTKDFIDSLRHVCAKIHLWIKSHCCFMLIIFRVDFSLIWRLSVLRHSSKHLHSVCSVRMPADTALVQLVVSAVAGQPLMGHPRLLQHSALLMLCEQELQDFVPFLWDVFVFFILCLNDDLIQNILNVSVLLLFLLFQWS